MNHFAFHKLNNKGIEKNEVIKMLFENIVGELNKHMTGDDRCKAIAMTKLEEACFFAKKSMACDTANQVKEGM